MSSSEQRLLVEFNARHSVKKNHGAWLHTATSFLENLTAQTEDHEVAASLLASSEAWSKEGLNTLAYASFCFWHRPLALSNSVFSQSWLPFLRKKKGAAWIANDTLTKLACAQTLDQRDQASWQDVTHLLALTSVAQKAVSLREVYEQGKTWSFQIELFKVLAERLATDPFFVELSKRWPDVQESCTQANGTSRPQRSFQETFSSIHLADVSERAAKIFCQAANDLFPNAISGISSVRAYYPKDGKGPSGSYYYSSGKGHLVLPDTFWPCLQTLPAFLAFTAHEVLHMHQMRSIEQTPDSLSPLYPEFLADQTKLVGRDLSCSTYSINGKCTKNTILPWLAYLYRPKEFFAHQFDGALQMVLAKAWETPFISPCSGTGFAAFARAAGFDTNPMQRKAPARLQAQEHTPHASQIFVRKGQPSP